MPRLDRIREHLRQLNPLAIGVELVIVFVGVYLAFALAEFRADRALDDRRDRVLAVLVAGLDRYETTFAGYADYHEGFNADVRATLARGEIPDVGDQLFVGPQYPIDVIAYLLTSESFDVFDDALYLPLTAFSNRIQQMMTVEAMITDLAERYVPLPDDADAALAAEQRQIGRRYLRLLETRRRIAADLAEQARELAALLEATDR